VDVSNDEPTQTAGLTLALKRVRGDHHLTSVEHLNSLAWSPETATSQLDSPFWWSFPLASMLPTSRGCRGLALVSRPPTRGALSTRTGTSVSKNRRALQVVEPRLSSASQVRSDCELCSKTSAKDVRQVL
jgi:hypothetical protein